MIESIPGVKLAYLIAGFAGGVVSLRYIKDLNWWQGISAIATGIAAANYITPVLQHFLSMPPALENGAAFIVGFVSLNILAGIVKYSEKWRDDPTLPGGKP